MAARVRNKSRARIIHFTVDMSLLGSALCSQRFHSLIQSGTNFGHGIYRLRDSGIPFYSVNVGKSQGYITFRFVSSHNGQTLHNQCSELTV